MSSHTLFFVLIIALPLLGVALLVAGILGRGRFGIRAVGWGVAALGIGLALSGAFLIIDGLTASDAEIGEVSCRRLGTCGTSQYRAGATIAGVVVALTGMAIAAGTGLVARWRNRALQLPGSYRRRDGTVVVEVTAQRADHSGKWTGNRTDLEEELTLPTTRQKGSGHDDDVF